MHVCESVFVCALVHRCSTGDMRIRSRGEPLAKPSFAAAMIIQLPLRLCVRTLREALGVVKTFLNVLYTHRNKNIGCLKLS